MMQKKVTIDGKEYAVKQTIRAIFMWEQISGREFNLTNTLDNMLYLFCSLLASNGNFDLSFDQFLDAVDENPMLTVEINRILSEQAAETAKLFPGKEDESDVKKKE